jgi:cyclohexadienyl dehydratase
MRALTPLIAALWTVVAAPALADGSRLEAILKRQVLRVGTTGDYRPFTALDKGTGGYSGFDVDMARALAKALGVSIAFAPTTWSGLAKGLADGDFDIAMGGVSVTLDRQKIGFFSAPYMRDGKTPIARCSDQEKYQTLAEIDRSGVTVIANPGGTTERFDRAHLRAADILVYPDNPNYFRPIGRGAGESHDHRRLRDPLPGEDASRGALRHPPRSTVRFRREGVLDASRPGLEGLCRSMAASGEGGR